MTEGEESTSPKLPSPGKQPKPHREDQAQNEKQVLEQQNQILREEIARLKKAEEVSQDRLQKLEGSLEKSMKPPLNPEELGPRERELLLQLIDQSDQIETWGDWDNWFRQLQVALAECPRIAKAAVVCTRLEEETKTFLLAEACGQIKVFYWPINNRHGPFPHLEVFQSLVKACPSELLWEILVDSSQQQYQSWGKRCIHEIAFAAHPHGLDIFLWLTGEYGWIFSLTENFAVPAHTTLMTRRSSTNALHSFFSMQPNFLRIRAKYGDKYEYPLNIVLKDSSERDNGDLEPLIRFMVSTFPESLRIQHHNGSTPLHHACQSLVTALYASNPSDTRISHCARAVAVVVEHYPQAALLDDDDGYNPIDYLITDERHMLGGRRYQPDYQESTILLLRVYFPRGLTEYMEEDEFFRRSYSLLEEEAHFCHLCIRLKKCSMIITKFAQLAGPRDKSTGIDNDEDDTGPHVIQQIYSLWAREHIAAISKKFESKYARLKNQLAMQRV